MVSRCGTSRHLAAQPTERKGEGQHSAADPEGRFPVPTIRRDQAHSQQERSGDIEANEPLASVEFRKPEGHERQQKRNAGYDPR